MACDLSMCYRVNGGVSASCVLAMVLGVLNIGVKLVFKCSCEQYLSEPPKVLGLGALKGGVLLFGGFVGLFVCFVVTFAFDHTLYYELPGCDRRKDTADPSIWDSRKTGLSWFISIFCVLLFLLIILNCLLECACGSKTKMSKETSTYVRGATAHIQQARGCLTQ